MYIDLSYCKINLLFSVFIFKCAKLFSKTFSTNLTKFLMNKSFDQFDIYSIKPGNAQNFNYPPNFFKF